MTSLAFIPCNQVIHKPCTLHFTFNVSVQTLVVFLFASFRPFFPFLLFASYILEFLALCLYSLMLMSILECSARKFILYIIAIHFILLSCNFLHVFEWNKDMWCVCVCDDDTSNTLVANFNFKTPHTKRMHAPLCHRHWNHQPS